MATMNSSQSQPWPVVPLMLALEATSKVLAPNEIENHGSQIEIIVMNVAPATILSTRSSRLWSKLTGGRLDGRGVCGPPPAGG